MARLYHGTTAGSSGPGDLGEEGAHVLVVRGGAREDRARLGALVPEPESTRLRDEGRSVEAGLVALLEGGEPVARRLRVREAEEEDLVAADLDGGDEGRRLS